MNTEDNFLVSAKETIKFCVKLLIIWFFLMIIEKTEDNRELKRNEVKDIKELGFDY